jgi:histidinol dehydrogenase
VPAVMRRCMSSACASTGSTPATHGLAVGADEIEAAFAATDPEVIAALQLAHDRIASHHAADAADDRYVDALGVELGSRWTAIEAVGLYVPGGTASYPSSVLMNAVPARVAGVERIVMVVPARDGALNPVVLAAARLPVSRRSTASAAPRPSPPLPMAPKPSSPSPRYVGPGNAWVAAAKRQVFGTVGIDMIAGPSEVLVMADPDNNPDWIAADLLAQAEHDIGAQSILMTRDEAFGDAVVSERSSGNSRRSAAPRPRARAGPISAR